MKNSLFIYITRLMSIFLLVAFAGSSLFFTSCEKEEDYGTPRITNIRTTNPDASNVKLDDGNMGQMVVIQGENLASTQRVIFNNVEAFVNPAYVTNTNIILRIPNDFPTEINDRILLVTLGGEATYNFKVNIPAPAPVDFPLEWVNEGDVLVIRGAYFYNIESIEFPGGVTTTAFTVVNPQRIEVVVPADVLQGPVKVRGVAGTGTTKAWFRDKRYMLIDYGEYWNCWGGEGHVVDAKNIPANVPVKPINGNFLYVKKDYVADSWWIQETVAAYCQNVSVPAPKSNWAFTFEMWVGEKWDKNWFEIIFTSGSYDWHGYEKLGGAAKSLERTGWMTVKIPLADIPNLTGDSFKLDRFGSFKAQKAMKAEFAFDNFRFTPLN
jgi:hypothetical protein